VKRLVIYVRWRGDNYHARIAGSTIRASCTSSPEEAVRRAAEKMMRGHPFTLVCEIEPRVVPLVVGRYVATATER
jgi:hypothetical protein